ncbi:MAG: thioesterase family protein [Pseudomonadota bacterium]
MSTACYCGFVNTWECDENAHMNVQFYQSRFEVAARHLWAEHGGTWTPDSLRHRTIRYHRECHAGQTLVGSGHRADLDPHLVALVLRDGEDGGLIATARDTYGVPVHKDLPAGPIDPDAEPFGQDGTFETELRARSGLTLAGYASIYRGIVQSGDLNAEGTMDDQRFITRVTDGVAHAWSRIGITPDFLSETGCGRVAVEMGLSITSRPTLGTLVHLMSGLVALGRTTVTFRHVFMDAATGKSFAVLRVTALIMNLSARKAIPFPDEKREQAFAQLVDQAATAPR